MSTPRTLSDLLQEDPQRVLTLAEVEGVNLADQWARYHVKALTIRKGKERVFFQISRPTVVNSTLRYQELAELEPLLRERCLSYHVAHHPPGHFKGQGDIWLATLELDCCYASWKGTITLVDFGNSYGKIMINDILVDISHGGFTIEKGWVDVTSGFDLVGSQRVPSLKSLITCLGEEG